jgi:hypothetical protein
MVPEDSEQVVVLRLHLEEWEEVLQRVYGYCHAHDLMECYRAGGVLKISRVTRVTAQAINRITGYLNNDRIQTD